MGHHLDGTGYLLSLLFRLCCHRNDRLSSLYCSIVGFTCSCDKGYLLAYVVNQLTMMKDKDSHQVEKVLCIACLKGESANFPLFRNIQCLWTVLGEGGTGVLRIWFGWGVRNPFPFVRVILTEKGTYFYRFFLKYGPIFQNFWVFTWSTPENFRNLEKQTLRLSDIFFVENRTHI